MKRILIILGLSIVISGLGIGVSKYISYSKAREQSLTALLTKQQNDANQAIENIKTKSESEINDLRNKIANIKPTIVNNITQTNDTADYSTIVAKWQNKVAKVTCTWSYVDGTPSFTAQGSAILVQMIGHGVTAITNKHVLTDDKGYAPDLCTVGVYGIGARTVRSVVEYNPNNPFYAADNQDWAYIFLNNPETSNDEGSFDKIAMTHLDVCIKNIVVGDKIVVLGYPGIGTQKGITATEGIISGLEGDFYVTSAKIDHGNSGGAAILVKDNCYLGIPTWVANNGGFESLGRIFKSSYVLSN